MGIPTSCFVIIGYGKKNSYANNKVRILDLDETFTLLIKPVFDTFSIPCFRAIDKNLSGSIDKIMLEEIKNADMVLADISTLNANVMWELGVRHAMKPHYTVMICEKEQMSNIPFDVNHFVVHPYIHSEEGIPYKEVERFRAELTTVVKELIKQNPQQSDSPVFTFLEDELKNATLVIPVQVTQLLRDVTDMDEPQNAEKGGTVSSEEKARNTIGMGYPPPPIPPAEPSNNADSFAGILKKAEQAGEKEDFDTALNYMARAKEFAQQNMTLRDNLSYIISHQAYYNYRSKKPDEKQAYLNSMKILEELNPLQSQDTYVLGISGAINKRLYDITGDSGFLDSAIQFYERGFQLKQDYHNGINATFMLYKKAAALKEQVKDWDDIKTKADFTRNSVLDILNKIYTTTDFSGSKGALWILINLAESWHYKNDPARMKDFEDKAKALSDASRNPSPMNEYWQQKDRINTLMVKLSK